jgi:hypothetical protein
MKPSVPRTPPVASAPQVAAAAFDQQAAVVGVQSRSSDFSSAKLLVGRSGRTLMTPPMAEEP